MSYQTKRSFELRDSALFLSSLQGTSLLSLLLLAMAAPAAAVESEDAKTYDHCMSLARQTPEEGFETASQWRDEGGGLPAEHCVAIALDGMKEYEEAANRLELLATEMVRETAALRAEVLSQAAEAWSEAGQPEHAEAALTEAMRIDPHNPDYPVSRSVAKADLKDYQGAIEDLDRAITEGGPRGDALAYRAAARRFLGDLPAARADADKAVQVAPGLPEAWLERANIRRLTGDTAGARKDWIKVLELAPDSPAADAARDNLEALDVHVEDPKPAP
jgi:tetratricopeptide (TPR) repeat protein